MDMRPVAAGAIDFAVACAYEHLLPKIGQPDFERTVIEVLLDLTPSTRVFMFDGSEASPTALRLARYEAQIAPHLDHYMRCYLPQDPVREAVKLLPRSDLVLLRLTPDDVRQEGQRARFFNASDIVERLSLVQRTSTGWRCMNISRSREDGVCTDQEVSRFVALAQLLLPMVWRHNDCLSALEPGRASTGEIESRFAERFPALSPRERQVCARAALGVGVEGTALDLGIALSSVLTYRRRAYARLRVTSPYELARLVLH